MSCTPNISSGWVKPWIQLTRAMLYANTAFAGALAVIHSIENLNSDASYYDLMKQLINNKTTIDLASISITLFAEEVIRSHAEEYLKTSLATPNEIKIISVFKRVLYHSELLMAGASCTLFFENWELMHALKSTALAIGGTLGCALDNKITKPFNTDPGEPLSTPHPQRYPLRIKRIQKNLEHCAKKTNSPSVQQPSRHFDPDPTPSVKKGYIEREVIDRIISIRVSKGKNVEVGVKQDLEHELGESCTISWQRVSAEIERWKNRKQ